MVFLFPLSRRRLAADFCCDFKATRAPAPHVHGNYVSYKDLVEFLREILNYLYHFANQSTNTGIEASSTTQFLARQS